ncbi:hypothetical protein HMI55_001631 [Coelomomyces lativittatus]|nr:hypothetical protein HMI55_001631 [Coelomomyces lativittatus]
MFRNLYLVIYNGLSGVCWTLLLLRTIHHYWLSSTSSTNTMKSSSSLSSSSLYSTLGYELTWMQTLAVFEILNALIGVVKSPILTTTMQVMSRLFIVWITLMSLGSDLVRFFFLGITRT